MNTKTALAAVAVLAASTFAGFAANANPIYLGYSFTGTPGSIVQIGTAERAVGVVDYNAGNFTISLSGTGAPTVSQGSLLSNTATVTSNAAGGTIYLYVSETGNTGNIASFTTGFGNNSLASIPVIETTYASAGNTPFAMNNQLSTATVVPSTQVPPSTVAAPANLTSTFTVTDMYTISFPASTGDQTVNATLNLQATSVAVPEPTTLAVLGAGLVGAGLIRRRQKA